MFPARLLIVYVFPFIYFKSKLNPHNDSLREISFSIIKSNPRRLKQESLLTTINIFISPLQCSFTILPWSFNTIISLWSIPLNISTYTVVFSCNLFPFSIIHLSISTGIFPPFNTISILI